MYGVIMPRKKSSQFTKILEDTVSEELSSEEVSPQAVEPTPEPPTILSKESFCEKEGLRPLSALGTERYAKYLNNPDNYTFKE